MPFATGTLPKAVPFLKKLTDPEFTVAEEVTRASMTNEFGQLGAEGVNEMEVVVLPNTTTSAEGADRALSPWVFTALTSNT